MNELLNESFKNSNLPVTILLLLVLFYWVINLVGIFDLDMLSGDAELDKGHIETETDSDSFLGKTFDFGDLPIAIVISFFVLFFWMITILTNYYLGNSSLFFALIIYIPAIIGSFMVTRIITIPLAKIYSMLKLNTEEAESVSDYTGAVCKVFVEATSESNGQGEINRNGDPIRVNIRTYPGKQMLKGSSALLIEYIKGGDYYMAEPYDSEK
jgi:hypothetical protein